MTLISLLLSHSLLSVPFLEYTLYLCTIDLCEIFWFFFSLFLFIIYHESQFSCISQWFLVFLFTKTSSNNDDIDQPSSTFIIILKFIIFYVCLFSHLVFFSFLSHFVTKNSYINNMTEHLFLVQIRIFFFSYIFYWWKYKIPLSFVSLLIFKTFFWSQIIVVNMRREEGTKKKQFLLSDNLKLC